MKNFTTVFLLILFSAVSFFAQTSNEVLARIGNQNLTVADLDAQTAQAIERLPQQIAELRKGELENEVADALFAAEAAALKTTVEKLLDLKVKNLVKTPTDADVQAVYDANRAAFDGVPLAAVKSRIVNFLKDRQATQIAAIYAATLQTKHKVVSGVNVNLPNLKPADVLATVGTSKITAERFNERLKPLEYQMRLEVYRAALPALDEAIYSQLIQIESQKTGVPLEDIIRREISDKYSEPTEADARKFYDENVKPTPETTFETAKNEILTFLADQRRAALKNDLSERLKKQNAVQILLKQPVAPILKISADDDPAIGSANAPVTIVMFSDFQCPTCAKMHAEFQTVLKKYGDKVRFVVRDFPLESIHARAFRAAQAAAAANAQGKFFEYIDVLYQNQNAFDDASLKKYAVQVGLNAQKFQTDLASGRFDAEIRKDMKDGAFYGIRGTPTIFVNGANLEDLSREGLTAIIEKSAAQK